VVGGLKGWGFFFFFLWGGGGGENGLCQVQDENEWRRCTMFRPICLPGVDRDNCIF